MPTTVIVPDEEQNNGEGKNSKNLFFTGDNLEVLRHLQGNYEDKVDMIYIDPPYNTGNGDFVYPDSFEYSDKQLHDMLGLDDNQIERLKSIQGKSSHSAWLTFMYPRLVLAKKLLADKGLLQERSKFKVYRRQCSERKKTQSILYKPEYSSGNGTREGMKLLGERIFPYPKPVEFIKDLIMIGSNSDSLVLDFFAGSSTTADAVMQLNAEDGGNRKFIMVQ